MDAVNEAPDACPGQMEVVPRAKTARLLRKEKAGVFLLQDGGIHYGEEQEIVQHHAGNLHRSGGGHFVRPVHAGPLRVGAARVVAFLVQALLGFFELFLPPLSSYSMA